MKVGDLVKYIPYADKKHGHGIIIHINDMHRQTTADILFHSGIRGSIWIKYLEVINETR